jgi:methylase of polypeptide subunit release factors
MSERKPISAQQLGLEIPDFTFQPNIWTEAFLSGLSAIDVKNAKVAEIGIGTGVVGINLIKRGVRHYVGVDIDDRILPVAYRNIFRAVPERTAKITLLASDLLTAVEEDNSFDLICGCLPQVGRPPTVMLGTSDSYARYFDSQKYQSDLNVFGLGLNESALIQSQTRIKPEGKVILVLSGRAGIDVINYMFKRNDFAPQVLFEDNIPQLKETTLATLVEYEAQGHEFFFYEDKDCKNRISVANAEQRRLNGQDSYHKLYIVAGSKSY